MQTETAEQVTDTLKSTSVDSLLALEKIQMKKNRIARSPEEIEANIIELESRLKTVEVELMEHLVNEHNIKFTKPKESCLGNSMQTKVDSHFTLSEIKKMLRKVLVHNDDVFEAWVTWDILNTVLDKWARKEEDYWKP